MRAGRGGGSLISEESNSNTETRDTRLLSPDPLAFMCAFLKSLFKSVTRVIKEPKTSASRGIPYQSNIRTISEQYHSKVENDGEVSDDVRNPNAIDV